MLTLFKSTQHVTTTPFEYAVVLRLNGRLVHPVTFAQVANSHDHVIIFRLAHKVIGVLRMDESC